jgi:hypothetical protein
MKILYGTAKKSLQENLSNKETRCNFIRMIDTGCN